MTRWRLILDRLIASGWGDIPQVHIPADVFRAAESGEQIEAPHRKFAAYYSERSVRIRTCKSPYGYGSAVRHIVRTGR